jgi:uncharacterized protein (TIGR02246 family)
MRSADIGGAMRTFVILLLALALPAGAAHRRQEREVRGRLDQFATTWATNDPQKLSALFTVHGDLINPSGRWARGRMEIEKLFTDEHSTVMKGSRMTIAEVSIRFLDDDLAVVDASLTIEAMKGPAGELPPAKYHLALVMRKHDDVWMFVTARPYAFATPPR